MKRICLVGLMLIMVLFFLVGCIDKGIEFNVVNMIQFTIDEEDYYDPVLPKIIKSVDELQQFCGKNKLIYIGDRYNEEFFEDNVVIIQKIPVETNFKPEKVNKIKVEDGAIVIHIIRYTSNKYIYVPRLPIYEIRCIEIIQENLQGIDNLQFVIKTKNQRKLGTV